MARGLFFQLTLIIGLGVERQSGTTYHYDLFDYCGKWLTMSDWNRARISVLGYDANTNLCELTFEAANHTDDLFYKFTNYWQRSIDVNISVYSKPTLTGIEWLQDSGSYFNRPKLNYNQRADRFIVVRVTRLGGTDFSAGLYITTSGYNWDSIGPAPVVAIVFSSCVVLMVIVVCISCAKNRIASVIRTTANWSTGTVGRSATRSTATNIGPRPSDLPADGTSLRSSISPTHDSDVPGSQGHELERRNGLYGSTRLTAIDASSSEMPNLGENSANSFDRQPMSISRIGDALDRSDDSSMISTGSNTSFVQPTAPLFEDGFTLALGDPFGTGGDESSFGAVGDPNLENAADGPPSYHECVAAPPPSYNEAIAMN